MKRVPFQTHESLFWTRLGDPRNVHVLSSITQSVIIPSGPGKSSLLCSKLLSSHVDSLPVVWKHREWQNFSQTPCNTDHVSQNWLLSVFGHLLLRRSKITPNLQTSSSKTAPVSLISSVSSSPEVTLVYTLVVQAVLDAQGTHLRNVGVHKVQPAQQTWVW